MLCSRFVLNLMEGLHGSGLHLYTDNFYTSPLLFHHLYNRGINACGTACSNQKHFPQDLVTRATVSNRSLIGECDTLYCYLPRKMLGWYVKTTMRMLTILNEVEMWTRHHVREACLLFASAHTKSSHYVRQSDKAHAQQITLLSLAP